MALLEITEKHKIQVKNLLRSENKKPKRYTT